MLRHPFDVYAIFPWASLAPSKENGFPLLLEVAQQLAVLLIALIEMVSHAGSPHEIVLSLAIKSPKLLGDLGVDRPGASSIKVALIPRNTCCSSLLAKVLNWRPSTLLCLGTHSTMHIIMPVLLHIRVWHRRPLFAHHIRVHS